MDGSPSGGGGSGGSGSTPKTNLASGISVVGVSLFQTVEVQLMTGRMQVDTRSAPIVAGKDAMIRVFLQPDATFEARPVTVALDFENDQGPVSIDPITGMLAATSSDGALDSTANFPIPGSAITANARFSVSIREAAAGGVYVGDQTGASWPALGRQSLLEQVTNQGTKVVLVPIRYDADSSGRLPDTSDDTVDKLRVRMLALYPTPSVTIRVTDPLPYANPVGATNGDDWGALLQTLLQYRQSNGALSDEYYYGMILPTTSEQSFCTGGCIAGLTSSVVGGPSQPEVRGSVGLGYPGALSAGTFVHELGHAHTLRHAPCSTVGPIQSVDASFPYSTGEIGVFGLDVASGQLKGPNAFKDMMGYCQPTWISDYHFAHLATEMQFVGSAASAVFPPGFPKKWRVVGVDAHGVGTLGVMLDVESFPSGELRTVPILRGGKWESVSGYFRPFDDLPGGLLLVPDDGAEPSR